MLTSRIYAIFAALLLVSSSGYSTENSGLSAEEIGLNIAVKAKQQDRGWGDSQADMTMILRNKNGQESQRLIRTSNLEVQNDGDKSLVIFDEPRDVQGTAFLNHAHPLGPDDQWLYLPALKRVKRISSQNTSGPFMGSEFAYEDMSSFEVEKYSYKYLRDETLNGHDCTVSEYYPVDKFSGYTRQVVWLDKTMYQPVKIEFYDRRNSLLKTLIAKDYQQHQGKYWRPAYMKMTNNTNGKSTVLLVKNYRFGTGLTEQDFNQTALRRVR
ncbi:outer membrane lipoprotein-sorting protein [Rheinheimera pleomorphica]|uniref:outer membrane lipoprotein-sorting protein n=1 Tax=Rheinheimera pleomorphica TaxID=2703963 RepID=UPI00141FCC55|nr:outer membrane lipoprotein-sorting protein [Rheinheimera pleomorphica]